MNDVAAFWGANSAASPPPTAIPPQTPKPPFKPLGRAYIRRDPTTIPPREWLYGHNYIRGCISVLVAPGGTGKSTLCLVEAIAMATGRALLNDANPAGKPLRVWYWNGEDAAEELQRRIEAICKQHQIAADDLADRLIVSDALSDEILLASSLGTGFKLHETVALQIERTISELKIDVAIFDPFISIHRIPESNNNGIDMVAKRLAKAAIRTKSAIGLCHHARKPAAGSTGETTMADSRGAVALIDAARIGRTLNFMTEEEASKCGIPVEQRRRYIRIDDGKANLAPRAEQARWFNLVSVDLGNETADRPADFVGVPVAWTMPGAFDGVSREDLLEVQRRADAAANAGDPLRQDSQAKLRWIGAEVADVLGLDLEEPGIKTRVKAMVQTWIKTDALKVEKLRCADRKERPCVIVGEWATDSIKEVI